MSLFQTYTGAMVDPFDLKESDIDIRHIAHALSRINRFAGSATVDFTVAQHSILVSELIAPEFAMLGLLHDAPEAYGMGDIARPFKEELMTRGHLELREFEHRGMLVPIINALSSIERSQLAPDAIEELKRADDIALVCEAWEFMRQPEWARERWGVLFDDTRHIDEPEDWPERCQHHIDRIIRPYDAPAAFFDRYNRIRNSHSCVHCDAYDTGTWHLCSKCDSPFHTKVADVIT